MERGYCVAGGTKRSTAPSVHLTPSARVSLSIWVEYSKGWRARRLSDRRFQIADLWSRPRWKLLGLRKDRLPTLWNLATERFLDLKSEICDREVGKAFYIREQQRTPTGVLESRKNLAKLPPNALLLDHSAKLR